MSEADKFTYLAELNRIKQMLSATQGFTENPELRGMYIALMTLEGAVAFDDLVDLGFTCAEFCKRKQIEVIESN